MPPKILVVDDEAPVRRYLRTALQAHGYEVLEAERGLDVVSRIQEHQPDLVLLDLGLPDLDGLGVTAYLRPWCQLPIIVLSVRGREQDKVEALDAGADDYLTKPFGISELLARIRAALRRAEKNPAPPILEFGSLQLDFSRRQLLREGSEVHLTPTEYELFSLMAREAGKVLTHRQLLRAVWGNAFEDEVHTLRVNISNLRKKIEENPARPAWLVTEPGVGYRLLDHPRRPESTPPLPG